MNSRDAFGVVVGCCENCGKTIYKHDTRYWVKLGKAELQMCKNCVVIEAEEDTEKFNDENVNDIDTGATETIDKRMAMDALDKQGMVSAMVVIDRLPSVHLPIWGLPVSSDRPLADEEVVSRLRDIQKQVGGSYAIDRAIEVIKAVQALPSAQPDVPDTNVGDMISRQAAIDIVWEWFKKNGINGDRCLDGLRQLSSVQPYNSCDGCKYENADDGVLVPCGFCKRSHSDNYERRTDG